MDATPLESKIERIKSAFSRLTGRSLKLPLGHAMYQDSLVAEWLAFGFTEADLEKVVRHIYKVHKRPYRDQMDTFEYIFGRPGRFHELLEDVTRSARSTPPAKTTRDTALLASGRPCDEPDKGPMMARDAIAKGFSQIIQELKKGKG